MDFLSYEEHLIMHTEFLELIESPEIEVVEARIDNNDYGEFLFVTIVPKDGHTFGPHAPTNHMCTFYGLGEHQIWGRVVSDVWSWYLSPNEGGEAIPSADAISCVTTREQSLPPHDNRPTRQENLALMLGLRDDVDGFIGCCRDFAQLFRSLT